MSAATALAAPCSTSSSYRRHAACHVPSTCPQAVAEALAELLEVLLAEMGVGVAPVTPHTPLSLAPSVPASAEGSGAEQLQQQQQQQ